MTEMSKEVLALWNNIPRLIKPSAPLVLTLREAGGSVLLWDRSGCVPASDVVPMWLLSWVAWKWWDGVGLRATLLPSPPLSLFAHSRLSCLYLILWSLHSSLPSFHFPRNPYAIPSNPELCPSLPSGASDALTLGVWPGASEGCPLSSVFGFWVWRVEGELEYSWMQTVSLAVRSSSPGKIVLDTPWKDVRLLGLAHMSHWWGLVESVANWLFSNSLRS